MMAAHTTMDDFPAVAERGRLEAKLERIAERNDRIAVKRHKLADELMTLTGELTVAREEAFTAEDENAARARVTKLEQKRDTLTRQIEDAKADGEAAGKARRKVIREIEALLFDRAPEFIRWATRYSEAADEALAALEAPLAKAIEA
jgi:chromosome segregation ATPase